MIAARDGEERQVAVVTGASSGIGKAVASALAGAGWHVIAHGRDADRSATAEAELRAAAAAGGSVQMIRADLGDLADSARLADAVLASGDRVHLLVNNAGGMRDRMALTADGNETTFAGNHLGHFLLTTRLLPLLCRAAEDASAGDVRIVNVSSSGHELARPIDWDDLQSINSWTSHEAYASAKLYNILFTRVLAKRVADNGIVVHAVHPGVVDTNFPSHGPQAARDHLATMPKIAASEAAGDVLWVATAPEAGRTTGGYFHARVPIEPSVQAQDNAASERLWTLSERLLAQGGFGLTATASMAG